MGTCREILESDHSPFDMLEGGADGELDYGEDENPFHDAETADSWHEADWKSIWYAHLICWLVESNQKLLIFKERCMGLFQLGSKFRKLFSNGSLWLKDRKVLCEKQKWKALSFSGRREF